MAVSDSALQVIMPSCNHDKRALYLPFINASMSEFDISTPLREAAFLSQLAHESSELTHWVENLNYSAKRLTQVWPNRFPTIAAAVPFANNPKALAEKTYGGRMGNNQPGDGYKFRGRFPLQITGGDLYRKASLALNIPELASNPDALTNDPATGFRVSAWVFAVEKGCNPLADVGDIKGITRKINGGLNGLAEREAYYARARKVLGA